MRGRVPETMWPFRITFLKKTEAEDGVDRASDLKVPRLSEWDGYLSRAVPDGNYIVKENAPKNSKSWHDVGAAYGEEWLAFRASLGRS